MALPQTGTKPLPFKHGATRKDADDNLECDPCRLREVNTGATAYCVTCSENLCLECELKHLNAEDTKFHTITRENSGSSNKDTCLKVSDELGEVYAHAITGSCERHRNKTVQFFCSKHGDVFCNECKEYTHARCPNVSDIKMAAKGIRTGKNYTRTIQEVRKMILQFEKLKTCKESQDDRAEEQLAECLVGVRILRTQINSVLDSLEKKVKVEIETRVKKEISEIRNIRNECIKRITLLQSESKELEEVKTEDETKCFISLIHAQQMKTESDLVLQKLLKDKKEWQFEFEPNRKLVNFLKSFDSLGSIKASLAKNSDASGIFSPSPLPSLDVPSNLLSTLKSGKEFVPCGDHVIHSTDDNKVTCSITGATFLADGRLLLVDNRNHNVKLLDQAIQLKSSVQLSGHPCDVTALNTREAVVTIPDKKQLDFLVMDPDIRLARTVNTELGCHGISLFEKGLLVTCYSHGVYGLVMLLDLQGRVKQRFDRDVNGDSLFQGPFFISPNQKRDRFYVSDRAANKVLCVSTGGKIIFSYQSKSLDGPGYMAVDKEGAVFICGRDSKNFHMINSHGRKIKIFSSEEGFDASAICCRASDGLFVICSHNSDRVKTYKLL